MSSDKPNDDQDRPDVSPAPIPGEERTLPLLQKIQTGVVDGKCIRAVERRQLVAFLMADGLSAAEIAQILKVSDRTIERDKQAIREQNAIARDPKLAEQMAGRLVGEADLSVQQIRKAVRDKRVSPAVKVDANDRCYRIVSDLTQRLQHLGFLPTASQKVEADLTHHLGELPDIDELQVELQRLRLVSQGLSSSDPQIAQQIAQVDAELKRASVVVQVGRLSAAISAQSDEAGPHERPEAEGGKDEQPG